MGDVTMEKTWRKLKSTGQRSHKREQKHTGAHVSDWGGRTDRDTHAAVAYLAVPAPPLPIPRGTVDQRERRWWGGGGEVCGKLARYWSVKSHTGADAHRCRGE